MKSFAKVSFSALFISVLISASPVHAVTLHEAVTRVVNVSSTLPQDYEFTKPLRTISDLLKESVEAETADAFGFAETELLLKILDKTLTYIPEPPTKAAPKVGEAPKTAACLFGCFTYEKTVEAPDTLKKIMADYFNETLPGGSTQYRRAERDDFATEAAKWFLRRKLHRLVFETSLSTPLSPIFANSIPRTIPLMASSGSASIGAAVMLDPQIKLSGILVDRTDDSALVQEMDFINTYIRNDLTEQRVVGSVGLIMKALFLSKEHLFAKKLLDLGKRTSRNVLRLQASIIHLTYLPLGHGEDRLRVAYSGMPGETSGLPQVSAETAVISYPGSDDTSDYFKNLELDNFDFEDSSEWVRSYLASMVRSVTIKQLARTKESENRKGLARLKTVRKLIPDQDLVQWLVNISPIYLLLAKNDLYDAGIAQVGPNGNRGERSFNGLKVKAKEDLGEEEEEIKPIFARPPTLGRKTLFSPSQSRSKTTVTQAPQAGQQEE